MADIFDIEGALKYYTAPEILSHIVNRRRVMQGTPDQVPLDLVRNSAGQDTGLQDLRLTPPAVQRVVQATRPVISKIAPDFGQVTGGPVESPEVMNPIPQSPSDLVGRIAGVLPFVAAPIVGAGA